MCLRWPARQAHPAAFGLLAQVLQVRTQVFHRLVRILPVPNPSFGVRNNIPTCSGMACGSRESVHVKCPSSQRRAAEDNPVQESVHSPPAPGRVPAGFSSGAATVTSVHMTSETRTVLRSVKSRLHPPTARLPGQPIVREVSGNRTWRSEMAHCTRWDCSHVHWVLCRSLHAAPAAGTWMAGGSQPHGMSAPSLVRRLPKRTLLHCETSLGMTLCPTMHSARSRRCPHEPPLGLHLAADAAASSRRRAEPRVH